MAAPPIQTPLLDQAGRISFPWIKWFQDLQTKSVAVPGDIQQAALTAEAGKYADRAEGIERAIGFGMLGLLLEGDTPRFITDIQDIQTRLGAVPENSQPIADDDARMLAANADRQTQAFPDLDAELVAFLGDRYPARDAEIIVDDVTANDVSITKHGFAPKAPNDATKYLDGTGLYSTPSGSATSGKYTPTLTNVANLDASTAYECQYCRVGNMVTVSGRVDIDPTLTATTTKLGISLPVASALSVTNHCGGSAFASAIVGQGAAIIGDVGNARAQMQWKSGDITNQDMWFTFAYLVE